MIFSQIKPLKSNLIRRALADAPRAVTPLPAPLALAYVGDAVFTLYVRQRLLAVEKNKVQVLHGVTTGMVSASAQAQALEALIPELEPQELEVVRHGRNTKANVPKSASMRQYRLSTGFECLLGWLYWLDDKERLDILLNKAFFILLENLQKSETDDYES